MTELGQLRRPRRELSLGAMPVRTALLGIARIALVGMIALGGVTVASPPASAQVWSLTTAQRQAYLYYYAPLLFKRGDENNGKYGRDWITSFDFDQDGNFSNNRLNWLNINQYVTAAAAGPSAYDRWRIRPTMYTALVEFMDGGSKSLVLLYHVYNAADKDGSQIHDWERIEIVVRNVTGTPGGTGESVANATITHHKDHLLRQSWDGLQFMSTTTGRHLMIWQADESDWLGQGPHAHELRFVTETYSQIASQYQYNGAEVDISNADPHPVHYVFVPLASSGAVSAWNARPLGYTTASELAARTDNNDRMPWVTVKRITYELQDLADILPTHWEGGNWATHWLPDESTVVSLESPIVNELGQVDVPAGLQRFYTRSRDIGSSNLTDGRNGVIQKAWFYGAYSAERNEDPLSGSDDFMAFEGLGTDSFGRTRGAASGQSGSHNSYWWQHDYFVHNGLLDDASTREAGTWLVGSWYAAANGGFDGRWVQLFDDRPGYEPVTLPVSLDCESFLSSVRCSLLGASGVAEPRTITWYINGTRVPSMDNATSVRRSCVQGQFLQMNARVVGSNGSGQATAIVGCVTGNP
jgi:hypothetical protein